MYLARLHWDRPWYRCSAATWQVATVLSIAVLEFIRADHRLLCLRLQLGGCTAGPQLWVGGWRWGPSPVSDAPLTVRPAAASGVSGLQWEERLRGRRWKAMKLGPPGGESPQDPSPERGGHPAAWRAQWRGGCGPAARRRPGIRSPQARIVRLSHFLWLYCLCPTPYCLVSFCPHFSAAVFYFPASLVVFISFV